MTKYFLNAICMLAYGCVQPVLAEDVTPMVPEQSSNEAAAQAWQQANVGASSPVLVPQEDGSTKIEWHGGVSVDGYVNSISSASGSFGSPLKSGHFFKAQIQSDLRGLTPSGDVNYFQFGLTQTNDRSVLSLFPRQINNIQLGRSGNGYLVAAGDVAPNFSSLSSSLGVRGLIGQKQIDNTIFSGYAGYVVPSWEMLEGKVPRTQIVREVEGIKLEQNFNENFKVYATGQYGSDDADSPDVAGLAPSKVYAGTVGFQYAIDSYQISGETASSHFNQQGEGTRSGNASIIDATWRGKTLSLRTGYHNLEADFVSLSQAATPGIRESYIGADWTAATWVVFGADLRNSKSMTRQTLFSVSQVTDTDSGSLHANINFGENFPGWGGTLQQSVSNSRDPQNMLSRNQQSSIGLNYSATQWNTSVAYSLGKVRNKASATYDSDTSTWQATIGRNFSNADGLTSQTWNISTNLNASIQEQDLLSGSETRAFTSSFTMSGQRNGWGSVNLVLSKGFTTRPSQSALRMEAIQLDATCPINTKAGVKLYLRDARNNIDDPALAAEEKVAGMQLSYNF